MSITLPRVESMGLIGGREYIVKKHRVAQEMRMRYYTLLGMFIGEDDSCTLDWATGIWGPISKYRLSRKGSNDIET